MWSLLQLTKEISEQYASSRSFVVSSEQISFTESGLLNTGKNEFILALDGSKQFARRSKVPVNFLHRLDIDLRATILDRCFHNAVANGTIGHEIRIDVNKENQVIGFDASKLLKIDALTLLQVVNDTLPKNKNLSTEAILVSRLYMNPTILSFSCFSPELESQPRVGDTVNGGIDIHHSITGELGTQVRCYLRRLCCENGACTHICEGDKHIRARRLPNGRFDEHDMIRQIQRVVTQVWIQLNDKLEAIKILLDEPRVSPSLLRQQRTRFSLSDRVLRAIEQAIDADELGPTRTQYDWFNAISRVATHDASLSLRQRRVLMFMSGELSQTNARMCDKCGSWFGG